MGSANRRNKSKIKKCKCYRLLENRIDLSSAYTGTEQSLEPLNNFV